MDPPPSKGQLVCFVMPMTAPGEVHGEVAERLEVSDSGGSGDLTSGGIRGNRMW